MMTTEEKREKNRLRAAAWRSAHPGEQNAYLRAYHQNTRDTQLAKRKDWYYVHRGDISAARKAERRLKPQRVTKTPAERNAARKAYRESNKRLISQRNKAYRDANPESTKAVTNAWREAHRERCYGHSKKWSEANPHSRTAAAASSRSVVGTSAAYTSRGTCRS